ncbi:thioredoxin family protein [Desulfofustis limnaeus]|jgi:hypothetical protein|uniref:Thioredoxin-like fold domain-containing protein n=1 Tax=Desulfofustis limnaeus TaxID=2740163 RepID=A0ABM7W9Y9_9BACT|nr:thioredoxin family protein [Desulfofustis limnaeus]MDX9896388.1 thioredoxin family protein [Desulfofustis sp.]BDD87762.1 hypothetical protein DPPLL_21270 [Desulfofustis limnaeus]
MDDYTKIRVGGQQVGVVGLTAVLQELAEGSEAHPLDQVGSLIRQRLAGQNYFAATAEKLYDEAFQRAYRTFVGLPGEPETGTVAQVMVLGAGCPRCEQLRDTVIRILNERGNPVDFEYRSDPLSLAEFGVLVPPALMVNGVVVVAGRIPSSRELQRLLPT